MTTAEPDIAWGGLIDVLLDKLSTYARENPADVELLYLTGSYTRGTWNSRRPNVNVYFIAAPNRAAHVRLVVGRLVKEARGELRGRGVDLMVDCHPFTISQRDSDWIDDPLLTLTTKVFAGEHEAQRYHIPSTIGLGWHAAHRVLVGDGHLLAQFGRPPRRDMDWMRGAHLALCQYKNILDHLPWALDSETMSARLREESFRYAEEALRDGVGIGLTDDEVAAGRNIEILHDWNDVGHDFYRERYGDEGLAACQIVDGLKAQIAEPDCSRDLAESAWLEALEVWGVVWSGYLKLADRLQVPQGMRTVAVWM